jgi:hypothetical protein
MMAAEVQIRHDTSRTAARAPTLFVLPSGRCAVPVEMQSYRPNLGELRSVHRPSKPALWMMLALGTPLLMIAALCTLLIIDSLTGVFTGSREISAAGVSNYFICTGVVGLLLALLGSILVSDYRAWAATKTVKLTIYQEGFTYESRGRIESCRWDEIEKCKSKFIEVYSKAFRTRVKVIRSIVKKDGTVINLAETLDLRQITELITTGAQAAAGSVNLA